MTLKGMHGVQKSYCKSGTGTHSTSGRQITSVMDLYAAIHVNMAKDLANGRMSDLLDEVTILNLGPDYTKSVFEERW